MEAKLLPRKPFLLKFSFGFFIKICIFENNPKSNFINWIDFFIFGIFFFITILVGMSTTLLMECKVFLKGKSLVWL